MAVERPDDMTPVIFRVGDDVYATEAKRGQTIHEAVHRALAAELTVGHRLAFAALNGDQVFADNFVGDIEDRYGEATLTTTATPITGEPGPWKTIGFDHLAITVADRAAARDFFRDVVGMQVMRDDPT